MKKLFLLAILFAAIESTAQTKDQQQILAILEKQTRSWNCGDLNSFMNGYWKNDSLMFIGKGGVTYGYDQTLANYRKNYPDMDAMGELKFTILKVTRLASDAYYIIGKYYLTREKVGDANGHYTLLFKKIKGQWVIVADHSS